MTKTEILQIITGFLGSCGFAVLFNIRGKRLAGAAIGGLLSWALFVLLGYWIASEPLRYFIVSVTMSAYSEILARLLRTPTTTFIMTALVPLIPGGSLYYTMAHALSGEWTDFSGRAIYTAQLAVALALGIVLTAAVMRFFVRPIHRKRESKNDKSTDKTVSADGNQ